MTPAELAYRERVAFGRGLRELRRRRRMTQGELGALIGVTQGTVSRIESAEQVPDCDDVFNIAAALHVLPSELFTTAPTGRPGWIF